MTDRLGPIELRFAPGAEEGTIAGYAAVFGNRDAAGDMIMPGAFQATLAQHRSEEIPVPMLWSHDPAQVIGKWTELREDTRGLYAKGRLTLEVERARETLALLRAGSMEGLSIGFRTVQARKTKAGRILTAIDLVEVSVVALPANSQARVLEVRSAITDIRQFERALKTRLGFPNRAARRLAAGGWSALADRDDRLHEAAVETRQLAKSLGGDHERRHPKHRN